METKKNATAALVVAIIGLILSLLFALDGLVLSMIGIVLAARAKAQQRSKSKYRAGDFHHRYDACGTASGGQCCRFIKNIYPSTF